MNNHQKIGREISLEEMKIIQIDILSAIDEFCDNHSIRYSMACGTLLGAIRHKGYIPWDDDIDIYVPREDYRKLIREFPKVYKDRYRIISLERSPQWNRPYAKAYDDKTLMMEGAVNNEVIGINIDIFPIDDVPDENDEWIKYNNKRLKSQKLFALKFVKLNKGRSLKKNIALVLFKLFTCFYSTRKWGENLDRMAQKNNNKEYKRCFECCQGLFQKKPFPKVLFDEIIEIPFENRSFKAFANADEYLRNGFGDYMQLPPEEKRVSHHVFQAYWKS